MTSREQNKLKNLDSSSIIHICSNDIISDIREFTYYNSLTMSQLEKKIFLRISVLFEDLKRLRFI